VRETEGLVIEIRRILCPIDFSNYSRRALDHAVAIARWYESTITVLHVFSTTLVIRSRHLGRHHAGPIWLRVLPPRQG
jgi:nucleotide-binding universal stress UspA family protein